MLLPPLGQRVAAVHAGQFGSFGADGLVQLTQFVFLESDPALELVDRRIQCLGIRMFDFLGKRREIGPRGVLKR